MAKLTLSDLNTAGTSLVSLISAYNANNALIESALENTLSRNGQSPNAMGANLDMNSYRIMNLPNAVDNQDPLTLAQAASLVAIPEALSATNVGAVLWPRTALEIAAGVTPTYYYYEPGDVRRYGALVDGITDDSTALQDAFDSGHEVYVPPGTLSFATGITLGTNAAIRGSSRAKTTLSYTGTGGSAFANSSPGTRRYNWHFRDFDLTDAGTGAKGLDLDSVSSSSFMNMQIIGFTTAVFINSPTTGYAVYNRFYNVTASTATTGFWMDGTSSNANVFNGCRSNVCTTGWQIDDSNDNTLIGCQIESGTNGVVITAAVAGNSDGNHITNCRFESNGTAAINLATNVRNTVVVGNYFVSTGGAFTDNGTRTIVADNAILDLHKRVFATRQTNGNLYYESIAAASSSQPLAIFKDSNTGSGTPSTVEIHTDRNAGVSLAIKRSGATYFAINPAGRIHTANTTANTNTPSGATARQLPLYNESGTLLGYIPVYGSAW